MVTMTTATTNWNNRGSVPIIYTPNNLTESEKRKAKTSSYVTPEIIGSGLQIYVASYQRHGDASFLNTIYICEVIGRKD